MENNKEKTFNELYKICKFCEASGVGSWTENNFSLSENYTRYDINFDTFEIISNGFYKLTPVSRAYSDIARALEMRVLKKMRDAQENILINRIREGIDLSMIKSTCSLPLPEEEIKNIRKEANSEAEENIKKNHIENILKNPLFRDKTVAECNDIIEQLLAQLIKERSTK